MNHSQVEVRADGTVSAYVGPDAVDLCRVRMLNSAIRLHWRTGMIPTRGITITKMFAMATQYTGKAYKRGDHVAALADLGRHIAALEASMPVVQR